MPDERPDILNVPDKAKTNLNIIAIVSKVADDNLTIVRSVSTGLAIVGIVILGRSIKLLTKFNAASEIPSRFIKRNVGLRGRVCSITDKGLEVEHIPIYVPVLSPLLMKYQAGAPLQVRLAGVELTPEGWDWLRRQLRPAETVWLKLIRKEGDSLDCFVSRGQGFLLGTSLNEQVLQQGLARSTPILGLDHHSQVYWRLHKRLLKAELKAERKGRGLWREDDLRERVSAVVRENIVVKGVKRLLSLISGTKEQ
ncbi:protein C3orf33 homolog [Alosa sapidissima]|uniref:protein C3orf33 homolog n=1 Tax=Alosa sapidissima TaxID=34773 RepID=UPI001C0A2A5C|nr:protein C3orf33 homolog [Alosa sapidissima]